MRGVSAEERAKTLDSFLEPDDTGLETVDRSELERWAVCPFQAKAVESGRCKIVGMAAEAGEAIHHALSIVTRTWVESEVNLSPWESRDMLRQDLEFELRRTRPDLQPEALAGMMPSAWAWSKFLSGINPGNILGFDGGDDVGRTSQFAYDFPDLGTRVTSELDLVYANPQTTELVDWLDYKTGHATHGEAEIAKAFQFQLHAVLLLHRFEEARAVRLRVWDTRTNHVSYTVTFPRTRFDDYLFRVREAVSIRRQYRNAEQPPMWPTVEGCRICHAAALCPAVGYPISAEPAEVLRDLIAVEARADALRERLTAWVDANQQDVRCNGVAFGRAAPKTERKAPAKLYDVQE